MNAKGGKKALKKKVNNGYQMAEPIKKGEILTDVKKNQWIIGSAIGAGGFGAIYAAASYSGKSTKEYPAVIKIEPHGNGPLFVEMHFYMRNANSDEIDNWSKKNKLTHLGMPKFLGSGSHEYNGTKYRFLVMERYGTDLCKLFLDSGHKFPEHTVYKVALQVINVLEYIHGKKYIHGDIKGANLLLDLKFPNNVYLVDFGLACHYTTKPEYKPDPKKAHDGTTEYTSRDAHMGVATMRGDLEILGYNLVQWLCGTLPWEKHIKVPVTVQKQKEQAFQNIQKFLDQCFTNDVPSPINQFMIMLDAIKFDETPNYDKFRGIFVKGLRQLGYDTNSKLEFKIDESSKNRPTPNKMKVSVPELSRKSPRIKQKDANVAGKALNESFNTLVNRKFVSGNAAKDHLLENVDFDSESEYDIQIKKRRKEPSIKNSAPEKVDKIARRGNQRIKKNTSQTATDSDSDGEIIPQKAATKLRTKTVSKASTRSKTAGRVKSKTKHVNDDSDSDMFEDN